MDLYVALNGNDRWSGRSACRNASKTDGPLATLSGALRKLRMLRQRGGLDGPVTVTMGGGRYEIAQPIVLTPADSWPVTFKARPGETPVISGGRRISGWRKQKLNGVDVWQTDVPEVREGSWNFRELFVNGERAPRPRLPRQGLYRMKDVPGLPLPARWEDSGQNQFVCEAGEMKSFSNLNDIEVVCVHFWIEERSPISAFDAERNLVTMARPSYTALVGTHGSQLSDYYLDNVGDALAEPGEWYLDRQTGTLTYVPCKGETPRNTEIIAPAALQLLAVTGDAEGQHFVEHVRFEGITFAHTDWRYPSADGASIVGPSSETTPERHSRLYGRGKKAAAMQASSDVPGVVVFNAARHCSLVDCTIERVGWYAVEIGDGCRNVRVQGCTLRDMGAGGVKINGASARDSDVKRLCTGKHAILDNEITAGGRVFHSAVGILAMHAFNLHIAHNHIHDLFYSGISCGWEWGYHEHVARNHLIEFNHIHDIGQGLLSDMGGIYTLGVQPGTVLRNNLIHGVRSAHYGGMCIYPDQGSSHILIENNICYDTDETVFHQNYGRENVIVNNIFALGAIAAGRYSQAEPHVGFTMLHNILLSDGVPIFTAGYSYNATSPRHRSDMNLLYDQSGKPPCFGGTGGEKVSLKRWKELGYDVNSVVADPGFKNLKRENFALKKDSPAFRIGFKPIDVSTVGPRPLSKRTAAGH